MQVLIFVSTINLSILKKGSLTPHDLKKSSECTSYDNKYTFYGLKWLYEAIEGFMDLID